MDTFRLLDDCSAAVGTAYLLGTLAAAPALAIAVSRLDPIGESEFEAEEGDR